VNPLLSRLLRDLADAYDDPQGKSPADLRALDQLVIDAAKIHGAADQFIVDGALAEGRRLKKLESKAS